MTIGREASSNAAARTLLPIIMASKISRNVRLEMEEEKKKG